MALLTFLASAVIILGTWVVATKAIDDGAWLLKLAAILVGALLLVGLYFLVSRREKRRS